MVSITNVLWWIRGAISTLQLDKISPLVEMTDYVETIIFWHIICLNLVPFVVADLSAIEAITHLVGQ
jgi:hypothetical protein